MRFFWILGVLLLIGCADPKRDAKYVAQEFERAMETGQRDRAEALLTRAARDRGLTPMILTNNKTASVTVGEAIVDAETARVMLTNEIGEPGALLLRREEGQWRVWGMQASPKASPFGPITLDFEKPEEELGRSLGRALGGMLKGFSEGMEKGLSESSKSK